MALSTRCRDDECILFTLNGQVHNVSSVKGDLSLNTYIREYAKLKGTKFMCREGGCGICIVSLQFTHPATGQERVVSVNSCMFPVLACHGHKVTTVEGIGSRKTGYNEIQSRLAHFYGTQCGYCTPGWVMSMYSFIKANPEATMKEIEDSFSGNLCRCTGYRPILDAFKSFASDRSKELAQKVSDIEDLLKVCPKSGVSCNEQCTREQSKRTPFACVAKNGQDDCDIEFLEVALAVRSLKLELRDGTQWYKVSDVNEIFEIFEMIHGSYRLVCGNTSIGILKDQPPPEVFIDINDVAFLKAHSFYSGSLYVGANTTLTDAIALFKAVSVENPEYFAYTEQLALHIQKVANVPVRNVGTIAGNLSIKHAAREFQSDIFLILEAAGALISIRGDNEAIECLTLPDYLETDMYKKVILQIILPPLDCNDYIFKNLSLTMLYIGLEVIKSALYVIGGDNEAIECLTLPDYLETDMYKKVILQIILPPLDCNEYIFKTYKIAPRAQNALAYVNAGFRFKVNKNDKYRVVELPRLVFGGINPSFIHAENTERYLVGRRLLDMSTLQTALNILGKEIKPDYRLPDSSPEYRRGLSLALFYRVILSVSPSSVRVRYRSGGEDITRPLSSGKQEFDTDSSRPPLYQPFPKLESLIQCSGEAEYIYDMPTVGNDVYAALVISKKGPGIMADIDPSEAMKIPGVIAFFSAKDIPGKNTIAPKNEFILYEEELFASKEIQFAGHQVGIVVALTQTLADVAAERVKIVYSKRRKPVLDVRTVVRNNDQSRIVLRQEQEATATPGSVTKVVKGDFKMDTQYHFMMETLTCFAIPTAEGLDVHCSTQWMQVVLETIALVLNIPENRINMKLSRVGGGYGQKVTRANIVGGACSLAAYLLQRPVRMVVKLETMMEAIGTRWPCLVQYEAGVNDEGMIQYMKTYVYEDAGSAFNDFVADYTILAFTNVYDPSTWSTKIYDVRTDKPCTAWARAPGTLEGVALAEHILEHIAHEVGKDPLSVRMKNLDEKYPIRAMVALLNEKADYENRKECVKEFNKANMWKKRALSVVPIRFQMDTFSNYNAIVSIYRNDGTVAIAHGGIECGQGINTKAAQVCA
ncbi:indole-3-acetaldehyde oxidase-like isoform X2 [Homalodisca vitripennis]|nr:indole-3-acetaldehyde oxidase-like isoform X2 [Homalodisca vitripennis]